MPETTVVADPFADNEFSQPYQHRGTEALGVDLAEIADENPELVEDVQPVAETPVEVPATPAPDEPETFEYQDGSSITIEKTNKGWKATLESGTAQPEVFYGKTKEEMFLNVSSAKIQATKKIREQNKQIKLGSVEPVAAPQPEPVKPVTADQLFEIKTLFASDPVAAFQKMCQMTTGVTWDQFVGWAKQGKAAAEELSAEGIAREFVALNPDYYPDAENKNYTAIVAFLAKHKLREAFDEARPDRTMEKLVSSGKWTVKNLTEAYEELSEAGLLLVTPEEPEEPVAVPATPAPAAPAPSSRIANTQVRKRPALGIRETAATATPPAPAHAASDEELENLDDNAISQLFAGVRKVKAAARR